MEQKIETIRQLCIKANPDRNFTYTTECQCTLRQDIEIVDPIRLADICNILNGSIVNPSNPIFEVQIEMIMKKWADIVSCWNLRKDNLELQNEFTINKILEIIL